MLTRPPELQVHIKSFGLGVYEAAVIPQELLDGDNQDALLQLTKERLENFGLGNLQELIKDKKNVGCYFAFFDSGHEPSKFEVSMMSERLDDLSEQVSDKFKDRTQKLSEYYARIIRR